MGLVTSQRTAGGQSTERVAWTLMGLGSFHFLEDFSLPRVLASFPLTPDSFLKAGWASSVHLDHSDLFLGLSPHGTLSFVRTQAVPYHCAPELNLGPGANAKRQGAGEMA